MDWLRGQNIAAKITTMITAAIAYRRRLSPKKSIATSRIWYPTPQAWPGAARELGRLASLATLHMRGLKRRMILLKPRRMVWPAGDACEQADLAR